MEPTVKHKQVVLVSFLPYLFKKPKLGDIVILYIKSYIIKRIVKIFEDRFFVMGDNERESTDSRDFGWIDKKKIVGKVIMLL